VFTVGSGANVNFDGDTYVAYLFAHDAGGFGLSGTDNVISCGSFTTNSNGQATVDLGYEPQWVMVKNTAVTSSGSAVSWNITDNMRGMPVGGVDPRLFANTSGAEDTTYDWVSPTATGFVITPNTSSGDTFANSTYIYIAIRRGPMKVPTTGTSVFDSVAYSGTGTNSRTISSLVNPDLAFYTYRNTTSSKAWYTRLQGNGNGLSSNGTGAEYGVSTVYGPQFNSVQTGYVQGTDDGVFGGMNASGNTFITYLMRRAPGFFDEVCYTGTGNTTTQNVPHNLGVKPQLMIVKSRTSTVAWTVYSEPTTATKFLLLNTTDAAGVSSSRWNDTEPTSSVFTVGPSSAGNAASTNYVAYLFASCPGVSKVGSYTGTGTTLQIDCGFTGGARFVLIKRTDSTGDWYVWDSARGIVAGNDPHLSLNTTAAEVTTDDSVDTDSTGFVVNQVAATNINVSSATYVFLAVA
jgi:hypothetical protein